MPFGFALEKRSEHVFGYPILSLIVYPLEGTPYASAFAVWFPYTFVIDAPTSVMVSYLSRVKRLLELTPPC